MCAGARCKYYIIKNKHYPSPLHFFYTLKVFLQRIIFAQYFKQLLVDLFTKILTALSIARLTASGDFTISANKIKLYSIDPSEWVLKPLVFVIVPL